MSGGIEQSQIHFALDDLAQRQIYFCASFPRSAPMTRASRFHSRPSLLRY